MPGPYSRAADEALDALCDAVKQSIADCEAILTRADEIRGARAEGRRYAELVPEEPAPLTVELLSSALSRLAESGNRWRVAQARALHAEGLSINAIAKLFGVTRQRVSALLQNAPDAQG